MMNPDPYTWCKGILKLSACPVYRNNRAHLFFVDPWDQNTIIPPRFEIHCHFNAFLCWYMFGAFETYLEEEMLPQARRKLFSFWFCLCPVSYRFVQGISTTVRAMPRQWNGIRSSSQIYLVRRKRREGKTRKKEKETNRRTKGGGGARACFTSRLIAGDKRSPPTQSTALEQKYFDLRSLSPALRKLWLLLVIIAIEKNKPRENEVDHSLLNKLEMLFRGGGLCFMGLIMS